MQTMLPRQQGKPASDVHSIERCSAAAPTHRSRIFLAADMGDLMGEDAAISSRGHAAQQSSVSMIAAPSGPQNA